METSIEVFLPIVRAALGLVALAQALARPITDMPVNDLGLSSPSGAANRTRTRPGRG